MCVAAFPLPHSRHLEVILTMFPSAKTQTSPSHVDSYRWFGRSVRSRFSLIVATTDISAPYRALFIGRFFWSLSYGTTSFKVLVTGIGDGLHGAGPLGLIIAYFFWMT